MSLILKDKIPSPEAWKGCDLVTANSWVHHLTETAVAALDNALCGIKKAGLQFPQFCKDDFPLPNGNGGLPPGDVIYHCFDFGDSLRQLISQGADYFRFFL